MDKITYIAVILSWLGLACENPTPTTRMVEVPVDSLYVVALPSFLQPGYDMHPFASLQYYDTTTQIFVLGLEDAKDNLGAIKRRRLKIKGYFNYVETTILERIDSSEYETAFRDTLPQGLTLQGRDYFTISDDFDEIPLYYRIAVYENDDYFYQLVVWMPYPIHCEYMPWIDSLTRSIRFMPPHDTFTLANSR